MYNQIKSFIANNFVTEEEGQILNVMSNQAIQIEEFNSMKATVGWKTLEKGIREELRNRLRASIEGDAKAQALLDILATVETKERSQLLMDEINEVIPQ